MNQKFTADTLSHPADSGQVTEALRTIKYSIQQARILGNDWKRELALIENTVDAALAAQGQGEAAAWLHTVTQGDGETDQALSFAPDAFPLDAELGFHSLGSVPLYTHPAPPASPAGVPDATDLEQLKKAMEDWNDGVDTDVPQHALMRLAELKLLVAETFEVTKKGMDLLAAAPSAPEGDGGAK